MKKIFLALTVTFVCLLGASSCNLNNSNEAFDLVIDDQKGTDEEEIPTYEDTLSVNGEQEQF